MPVYNTNINLDTQFTRSSRVWAGPVVSTFQNDQFIDVDAGAIITAEECTIVTERLGTHNTTAAAPFAGTLDFTNVVVDMNDIGITGTAASGIGGSDNIGYDWTNVRVLFTNQGIYRYFGSDHTRTIGQPVVNWNNVELWGDTTNNTAALAAVFTDIHTSSVISGVSLTNGEAVGSANLKGAILQGDGRLSWPNVTLGPLSTSFNGVGAAQLFMRFAAGNVTVTSHIGVVSNLDFRSMNNLAGDAANNYIMDIDAGAHVAFINWLPGQPIASNSNGFVSNFGNAGRAHVFVATNPDLGTGDHLISFNRATVNPNIQVVQGQGSLTNRNIAESTAGVLLPATEAWDRTRTTTGAYNANTQFNFFESTPATGQGLVVDGSDVENGIFFQHQGYSPESGSSTGGYDATVRNFQPLTGKSYRKYSWTQQPSSINDTEGFGKLITVSVPVNGATDAQVATARAGGYDLYNGNTWETSTDVSDPIDAILSQTALNTVAKTTALVDAVGGATIGSHLVAGAKLATWLGTDAAGVTDANTRRLLNYDISGTGVTFAGNLELSATAPNVSKTGINYILPMGDIAVDEFITEVTATSTLTINGSSLNTTTDKVAIGSDTLTVLDGNVRNIRVNGPCRFDTSTARTYTDLSINGDIQSLRNVHTVTGLSVIGSRTVAISGFTGTLSVDDVLGTGWSTTGTITLTSATALIIQVDADDLTPLGVNLTQGNTVLIGNITYDYPAAPAVDRTINFSEVNTGDQYVIVESGTTGSTTVASGTATAATTVADWAFTRDNSINTTFDVYYKKFGDVDGGTPTQYYVTRRTWNPMTDNADLVIEPTLVPGALSQDGITDARAFFTETFSSGNAIFTLDRTATGFTTATTLTENISLSLALALMNTSSYFRAVWENRIVETETSRLINIGRGNSVAYNQQGSHIRIASSSLTQLPNISGLSTVAGTTSNIGASGSSVPSVTTSTQVEVVGSLAQISQAAGGDRLEDIIENQEALADNQGVLLNTAHLGSFKSAARAGGALTDLPNTTS